MEAKMLLKDPEVFPTDGVLQNVLGEAVYSVLESLRTTITGGEYGLQIEWRYYNDGKAWLGKVVQKKKTIFWLSVWEGFFKTGFYFTEKHLEAIAALDISDTVKQNFASTKSVGRLLPLIMDISDSNQLPDLLTVVRFKKSVK